MTSAMHRVIAQAILDERGRGLTKGELGILRAAATKDDPADLMEYLPGYVERVLTHERESHEEGERRDAEFEGRAQQLAAENTVDALRKQLAYLNGNSAQLAAQHEAGLRRMGSGHRPTAAAVAGEASQAAWPRMRLLERAIEISTC